MANIGIPAPPQNQDEGAPLGGLYFDRPPYKVDPKAFSACNNVRIEQGRVRSDLMGWASSLIPQLPGPCTYLSAFVDSFGNRQLIAVTTTDIIFCAPGQTNTYMTPTINYGNVSVQNGTNAVSGMATRWATDIQFGDQFTVLRTAQPGSTNIVITVPTNSVPFGVAVTSISSPGSIQPGTYFAYSNTADDGTFFIVLSKPTLGVINAGDTIQLGNAINIRQNLRAGDQIHLGSNSYNTIGGDWYTIKEVVSDTQVNLTTNFTGSTLVEAPYVGRQLLTDTTQGPNPYLPTCFSSNQPASGGFNGIYSPSDDGADLWLFTNGVDPVVFYSKTFPQSCLYARTIPYIVSTLTQSKGVTIYGGLTQPGSQFGLGSSIASSDNGFPMQLAGGVSFQGIALDGPFQITRVSTLGSTVMIYTTGTFSGSPSNPDDMGGSVVSASFVGFPTIWAFSDVVKTRGPLNGGAVAEFPDRHQFLATDGEYRYNGLFIQVMNDQVWRQVLKSYDGSRPWAMRAVQCPSYGDLIWSVPLLSDPTGQLRASTAYVEHFMEQANSYLFKPMTQRDFPFTAVANYQNAAAAITFASFGSGSQPNFNQNIEAWATWGGLGSTPVVYAGDISGNIWQLYTANTQNGTPVLSTCTWGSRIIGNARSRSLVTRVYPSIEYIASPVGNVSVTLSMQDALAGPALITDIQSFNPNYSGNRFTTHYRRGRVATVTFSDSAGVGWVCDGYDFDWTAGGLR